MLQIVENALSRNIEESFQNMNASILN